MFLFSQWWLSSKIQSWHNKRCKGPTWNGKILVAFFLFFLLWKTKQEKNGDFGVKISLLSEWSTVHLLGVCCNDCSKTRNFLHMLLKTRSSCPIPLFKILVSCTLYFRSSHEAVVRVSFTCSISFGTSSSEIHCMHETAIVSTD